MTPYEERDAELASLIRREIDELKDRARACNWHPTTLAWHRAFGELSGMHRILALIDPDPGHVSVKDLAPSLTNGERK